MNKKYYIDVIVGFLASCRGEQFDRSLVHSIESIIIDWSHQIQNVLKRDSAQPLLEGTNPGPIVELDFWKARAENLECIFEQVERSYCYQKFCACCQFSSTELQCKITTTELFRS